MTEIELSAGAISHNLGTLLVGQRVIYFPSLPSTNETARQEAQQGAPEGTTVVAGEQVGGRGRLQRAWVSPGGSIALSVVLFPGLARLPSLIMVASLAVAHSIEKVTGLVPQVKWPNDVLLDGHKVSGILIETSLHGKTLAYAVIGIGINANVRIADFPELRLSATSLSDKLGREVSRLEVIRQLLVEMERLYLDSAESVYKEWRSRLVTLGKPVRVRSGETIEEGIAESVAADGSLLLRRPDGSLATIVAGDATLRQ